MTKEASTAHKESEHKYEEEKWQKEQHEEQKGIRGESARWSRTKSQREGASSKTIATK